MVRKIDHYLSLEEIGEQIQAMEDEFTYKQINAEYKKAREGYGNYQSALNGLKRAIDRRDKKAIMKKSADMTRFADTLWIGCLRIKALTKYLADEREAQHGDEA